MTLEQYAAFKLAYTPRRNLADPAIGTTANIYKSEFFSEPRITNEGFLKVDTVLFRKCVLPYPEFGTVEFVGDAIYSKECLDSADGIPFVLEHPVNFRGDRIDVTPENFATLIKGVVTNPRIVFHQGENIVIATLVIYDPEVIQLVLDKKLTEVSQGYYCVPQNTHGCYNSVNYDTEQTKIKFNHLALVANGRAGDSVRLLYNAKPNIEVLTFVQNSKGTNMKKNKFGQRITANGILYTDPVTGKKDPKLEIVSKQNAGHPNDEDRDNEEDDVTPVDEPVENTMDGGGREAFLMQMLQFLMPMVAGNGQAPAPAMLPNSTIPDPSVDMAKEKLIGNALAVLNELRGNTQPAPIQSVLPGSQLPVNQNPQFGQLLRMFNALTTGKNQVQPSIDPANINLETRKLVANAMREDQKTMISAQAIYGGAAVEEVMKYNSTHDFRKAALVEVGFDEAEVEGMPVLEVKAHYNAHTSMLKTNALKSQDIEGGIEMVQGEEVNYV